MHLANIHYARASNYNHQEAQFHNKTYLGGGCFWAPSLRYCKIPTGNQKTDHNSAPTRFTNNDIYNKSKLDAALQQILKQSEFLSFSSMSEYVRVKLSSNKKQYQLVWQQGAWSMPRTQSRPASSRSLSNALIYIYVCMSLTQQNRDQSIPLTQQRKHTSDPNQKT